MGAFVGIDLGTTFSVVATIDAVGQPQCIRNEYGSVINPSVVYLGPGGPLVGEEAKERQANGDPDVASFFKRSMGDPNFILEFQGKSYTPVDLSALVLKKLKTIAEAHLGQAVTQAVVTVPAYFNNSQRSATIQAGKQAGLEVLAIISEPTAAALAYGMRPSQGEQTTLVYDLGGGTFDVSVVKISPAEQRVIGTGGDHNLGGKDWDDRIFNFLMARFQDEFGSELAGDDINELLVLSENAKKDLSTRSSVEVRVQAGGRSGVYSLTRADYENMTHDLLERTQRLTEQTLEEINLSWKQIDQVLLVGGSTRMPMVRKYVEAMSGRPPAATINPDEAVALGAAIQAAMEIERLNPSQPLLSLSGRKKSVDVMSHSLGMIAINDEGSRYVNSILIRKNQAIPCVEARPYTLQLSQRGANKLEVYLTQGESGDPLDCAYLGKYVFSEIPALKDKKAVLDISYAYDKNGVVDISAVERSTRQKLKIAVEALPADVPQRFSLPPRLTGAREFLTVYMAFDLSGSMRGAPLAEAKKAASAFLSQMDLSSASIGLISFSDQVRVSLQASQNANEIEAAIQKLSVGSTGHGNSGQPFDEIFNLMSQTNGLRYALVLADGVWHNQYKAVKQAQRCHEANIEVIGIGFGGVDKKFMQDISSSDENTFLTSMNQLVETFSSIAQELTEGRAPQGRRGGLQI